MMLHAIGSLRKIVGLTLIEMMLVVTVIAVATLTGLKILKNRTQINAINTVATQMQSVAQGVVAYYMANHNTWPTPNSTVPSSLAILTNNPENYTFVSPQALCTPFPGGSGSGPCANFAEIQGEVVSNAGYYNLVLSTDSNSTALAIAGQLPNAIVSNNTITMSVTPPAQYFSWNPNKGWIVSAGVVSTTLTVGANNALGSLVGGHLYLPNCPTGFEGHVMFFPERYQTVSASSSYWGIHMTQVTARAGRGPFGEGGQGDSPIITQNDKDSIIFNTGFSDSHGNTAYATTVGDEPDSNIKSVEHSVFFMTFCLPIGHWGTHYINTDWLQDGQCSTSWVEFLQSMQKDSNFSCNTDQKAWTQANPPVGSPDGY